MIQRIQSLYLLFVSIIAGLVVSFIANELTTNSELLKLIPQELLNLPIPIPMIVIALIGLISLITIFLFKKRSLQMTLIKFTIFINVLLLGLVVYLLLNLSGETLVSEKGIWVSLSLFASVVFLFLAYRAIKKDDNLVKSVDRLR